VSSIPFLINRSPFISRTGRKLICILVSDVGNFCEGLGDRIGNRFSSIF
jgi:hypothetical protein